MSSDWKEVPEQRYDEQMGVLPPAIYTTNGFLVGEPHDHRPCKVRGFVTATYAAFVSFEGRFFEGPNMTVAEFKKLDITTVLSS
jgi:hypothetical protein